jgi:hypothetical protein
LSGLCPGNDLTQKDIALGESCMTVGLRPLLFAAVGLAAAVATGVAEML